MKIEFWGKFWCKSTRFWEISCIFVPITERGVILRQILAQKNFRLKIFEAGQQSDSPWQCQENIHNVILTQSHWGKNAKGLNKSV